MPLSVKNQSVEAQVPLQNSSTLHCVRRGDTAQSEQGKPWLVWLHGFLGNGDDWQAVTDQLADYPLLTVDLPGHGGSTGFSVRSMAEVNRLLTATLAAQGIHDYWLIGYSMGGRIAAYHATQTANGQPPQGLCGLILEGAHPGLPQEEQCLGRWYHDRRWAERFRREPLADVLRDWYRQSVFADLNPTQRGELQQRRAANDGRALAMMLEGSSLGRQPQMGQPLRDLPLPFHYLCGETDLKFVTLARQHGYPLALIPQAGHNAHYGNPTAYAAQIRAILAQASATERASTPPSAETADAR
ncbi:2-succinyl-6-hydroxy-2,4-cyclohexadiene-1-carboxylate synthase [Plesiomonas shigelloides]|uniref:2-succinyl-6-hydroxy-2, 4-cyclohexadiene-1-carboxylate synthase n=1 Tax=Plesiomonas shigelloides TaxID=703 RepID=UPI001C05A4F3|nr:2-succinyl-6-hydroxy-2,4-cyclohexadiene-1-carboxylate synthase [Plesiomonas shigelloides]QWK93653.1 2-succinyl-6-hydroxy-2,4-cyclohexadiene-1-carboxylate synthase [Plesiomonas shigelloides]